MKSAVDEKCHPETALPRSAEEGPYDASEAAWKSARKWKDACATGVLFTSAMAPKPRKVPLSFAYGERVRDNSRVNAASESTERRRGKGPCLCVPTYYRGGWLFNNCSSRFSRYCGSSSPLRIQRSAMPKLSSSSSP